MNKKKLFLWGFLLIMGGAFWVLIGRLGRNPKPPHYAEQAAASVVNVISGEDTITLDNPKHHAEFTSAGVIFQPKSGPEWQWQLTYIGDSEGNALVPVSPVIPQKTEALVITYARGTLVESYIAEVNGIEQQFIIPQPLPLNGNDLLISGNVTSPGVFESLARGWLWRNADGVVSLGDVFVYDANGIPLEAILMVSSEDTRIAVKGSDLAKAAYPVTIDPEIGTNDFRISDMGTNGDQETDANDPDVAYNPRQNQYLVVWSGEETDGTLNIYGQRIDAETGAAIGTNDFLISDAGNSNVTPAVAYNSINNEYLIVWAADPVLMERDIYGQRINAVNGNLIGTPGFRISDMGPNGDPDYAASNPSVGYNPKNNEYLVVWEGEDNSGSLVDGEIEIFAQRIAGATGNPTGTNDFRVSDMGPDGDTLFRAGNPAVTYNYQDNEYLVVWEGDNNSGSLVEDEFEIFGQRVPGDFDTGNAIGTNDFRLSAMGPDGNPAYDAVRPAVAYNPVHNEYLVVWMGSNATLGENAYEIFAQRLNGTDGSQVGNNDFKLSEMGAQITTTNFNAAHPKVAYAWPSDTYLVVWRGDDDALNIEDAFEVFGQQIEGDRQKGDSIEGDKLLSDMGNNNLDDPPVFTADKPAIAYSILSQSFLIVWRGDDEIAGLVDNEVEIYGQRFAPPPPDESYVYLPVITR